MGVTLGLSIGEGVADDAIEGLEAVLQADLLPLAVVRPW